MDTKTKKYILYCVITVILCVISFGIGRTRKLAESSDTSNRIEWSAENIDGALTRVSENNERIEQELADTKQQLNDANTALDECQRILSESQTRLSSCSSSLDGIEQWIDIYEETIKQLNTELRERRKSTEKQ